MELLTTVGDMANDNKVSNREGWRYDVCGSVMVDTGLFAALRHRERDALVYCIKSIFKILDLRFLPCASVLQRLGFQVVYESGDTRNM